MKRELLNVGDRLISITTSDGSTYNATKAGIVSIGVAQLPGPMGFYLVANVVPEGGPDIIVPLHTASEFRVSNP
jgi:hypothetical protein